MYFVTYVYLFGLSIIQKFRLSGFFFLPLLHIILCVHNDGVVDSKQIFNSKMRLLITLCAMYHSIPSSQVRSFVNFYKNFHCFLLHHHHFYFIGVTSRDFTCLIPAMGIWIGYVYSASTNSHITHRNEKQRCRFNQKSKQTMRQTDIFVIN